MSTDKLTPPTDPVHLLQASTFHFGIVRDVKDPTGRGRVRIECPSINGSGKDNWLNWAEVCGVPVGSVHLKGDAGMWWPCVPGQAVFVGFVAGDYEQPFCIPGPVWQEKSGNQQEMIPANAKAIMDQDARKGTRIRELKSESGAGLFIDDNGKSECMTLTDRVGAGLFSIVPGKKDDEKEQDEEESRPRKGDRREHRFVFAKNAQKFSETIEGEVALQGLLDINGNGLVNVSADGEGYMLIQASNEVGKLTGPSIVLDAKNDRIILTAKDTQLQIMGDKGKIQVTRQIIQEQPKIELKDWYQKLWGSMSKWFERYKKSDS